MTRPARTPRPAGLPRPARLAARRLFARLSPAAERSLASVLRTERAGGALLLLGALVAVAWASSPWSAAYATIRDTHLGPAALHLDLSVGHWAADGLLTIFFFVVGLELKREIVGGELRRPATAALPIVAAMFGMAVPAALYLAVVVPRGGPAHGWAVPTATDIAFAVAVLGIVGRSLPSAMRAFLLTLAVVDDLLAIVVIAVAYSDSIALGWLAASLGVAAVFALLVRRGVTSPWLLVPLGLVAWATMHASGVHATIAGVVLGLVVPATAPDDDTPSLAERFEHAWRPLSAGVAVPLFALFAAGVSLDLGGLSDALRDPVAQGIAVGLVVGKPLGIIGGTWLVSKVTRTPLAEGLGWSDVGAVGLVAGIGFTVSLLIGSLAFGEGSVADDHVRTAVLAASVVAAILGGAALARRDRVHAARRTDDDPSDGAPTGAPAGEEGQVA
jgi:NhaA family Na+:H+ antiporter